MAGLSPRDLLASQPAAASANVLSLVEPMPVDSSQSSGPMAAGGRLGAGLGKELAALQQKEADSSSEEDPAVSSSNRKRHVADESQKGVEPHAFNLSSPACPSVSHIPSGSK